MKSNSDGINPNIHSDNSKIFNTANKLLLCNQFKEAENNYLKLLGQNIYNPSLFHNLGLSLELQENIQHALEVYFKNIEFSSNYIKSYLGIANCFIFIKDYKNAIKFLEQALKIDINYEQTYFIFAEISAISV